MRREVDLDALIGADALVIKVGGVEYVIDDIPLNMFLEYVRAVQTNEPVDEADMTYRLLKNFNPDITLEQVRAMGVRRIRSLLMMIVTHFGSLPKSVEKLLTSREEPPSAAG
jgi:hypothetical protein